MIILWQFSTTVMLLKKRDHPKACLFYDGQNTVKTADKSQSNKFLDFQKLQAYQKIELIRQSYDARLVRPYNVSSSKRNFPFILILYVME